MILTDREIGVALKTGQLRITPEPAEDQYASSSVDLTLGATYATWKEPTAGVQQFIDPSVLGFDLRQVIAQHTEKKLIGAEGLLLKPRMFVLAWTREEIHLPESSRLAARVEGKSSFARMGVGIHITAPTIHVGFRGDVQLEIINHGSVTVCLKTGMRICQLIFEQSLGTPEKGYRGIFQGQKGETK